MKFFIPLSSMVFSRLGLGLGSVLWGLQLIADHTAFSEGFGLLQVHEGTCTYGGMGGCRYLRSAHIV